MLVKIANGSVRHVDDIFGWVAGGEPLPPGPVIVSLRRFEAEKDTLFARALPLGVGLEPGEPPEALGKHVHRLSAVVLHIPHFKDGRAFSAARLLRTRLGFKGEIRATGHILKDQLAFYVRVGVDTFALRQNLSLSEIGAALHEIANVYQPSVDGRATIRELRAQRTQGGARTEDAPPEVVEAARPAGMGPKHDLPDHLPVRERLPFSDPLEFRPRRTF